MTDKIKLVAFDIDGTLTDGRLTYIGGGQWSQSFSVRDGVGIRRLLESGIKVALISAKDLESARARAEMLGIKLTRLGVKNKLAELESLLIEEGVQLSEAAYIGDELDDIPVILAVGLGGTVPEAPHEVRRVAAYVTKEKGGFGAAREFAELVLKGSTPQSRRSD